MRSPTRPLALLAVAASVALLAGCTAPAVNTTTPEPTEAPASTSVASPAGEVQSLLEQAAAEQVERHALGSLLAEVRIDGEVVGRVALGEAMAEVPISVDGRFRNGAVAITYVSTVMLRLAEEGVIDLDEPIEEWLPDLPDAELVTPRMLANMTAGYPDHVANTGFVDDVVADPFLTFTNEDLIEISRSTPRVFEPGENWDYSHSDYVVLGEVMEAASGSTLEELIDEYVLAPLDLDGTVASQDAVVPEPVVHAFTAERGVWEDSTYWNPSWTLPEGAVQTSTISDIASSFDAIVGRGELLEEASYEALIDPALVGFGEPLDGCPACHTMTTEWSYGLGTVLVGDWVKQTPLFGGYASTVLTLPESRTEGGAVTIAVAVTYTQDSFDDWIARLPNWADELALELGAELVPDNPPPLSATRG